MATWTAVFDDDEELGELLDLALGDNDVMAAAAAAQKRRMAAAAAVFPQEGGQGPGGKKVKVKEFSWAEHVRRLTESQFQRRYRLNWRSFYKLLKIIARAPPWTWRGGGHRAPFERSSSCLSHRIYIWGAAARAAALEQQWRGHS